MGAELRDFSDFPVLGEDWAPLALQPHSRALVTPVGTQGLLVAAGALERALRGKEGSGGLRPCSHLS